MKSTEKIRKAIVVATIAIIASGHAQTTTWTLDPADGEGNWFTTGSPPIFITHWNNGEPTASTDAIIANGGTAFLSTQQAHAKRVMLGSSSPISSGGSLRIGNTASTAAPGILSALEVSGGFGDSKLIFSHNDNSGNYYFTRTGAAPESANITIAITGTIDVISESGTTVLVGNNTYIGTTRLNGGKLVINNNQNLGDESNSLSFNGGALQITGGSIAMTRATSLGGGGGGTIGVAANSSLIHAGSIGGFGELRVQGNGSLTLSGANTYLGGTQINGGTLIVSGNANLGDINGELTFSNGGTLSAINAFSTNRAVTLNNGGGILSVIANRSLSLNNVISGEGQLTKRGIGTLNIIATAASNTYSGGTAIEEGRVVISGPGSSTPLGAGSVAVGALGALSGQGRIIGDVAVAGELSPGLLGSHGLLDLQADLAVTNTGLIQMTIGGMGDPGIDHDAIRVAGTFLISQGATLDLQLVDGYTPTSEDDFYLFDVNQFSGATFIINSSPSLAAMGLMWDASNLYSQGILSIAAIPEPSTWFLLGVGGVVVTCCIMRKKRKNLASISYI